MSTEEEIDTRTGILLQGLIDNLTGGIAGAAPGMVKNYIQALSDTTVSVDVSAWDTTVDEWQGYGFFDAGTGDVLKQLGQATGLIGLFMRTSTRVKMIQMLLETTMEVVGLDRQYDLMSQTTPNPAPADNLVRAMMLDPGRSTENRDQMKRLGYDDTQIDNIILSHYNLVPEGVIRINFLRGNIDSDKMYERMRELGYTDTRTKEIVQTWTLYPPPQDLFTMVAHEAFEPTLYTAMGLDAEFPAEQVPWLEAQGISKEWAMKYWISHWNQPSIGQGFEMLHRGVITEAELDMLFKVVEIPSFWREKLKAITFNPYTRVDTRRMHDLGVLSTEELVISYQDIGYSAEKAVKMAEFTLKFNAEGEKQLTRSVILDSFKKDLITRSDAKALLIEADYEDDVAEFYLTNEEYKQALDVQKIYLDIIEDKFKLGIDTESETRSALNQLNLRGTKIDALLDQWNFSKYKYQDLPTHSELNSMLIEKIISEGEWRSIMTRRGYSYQHQGWYLQLIDRAITVSKRLPTKADITAWFKGQLITTDEYRGEMTQLGYSDRYIDLYLKQIHNGTDS